LFFPDTYSTVELTADLLVFLAVNVTTQPLDALGTLGHLLRVELGGIIIAVPFTYEREGWRKRCQC